MESSVHAHYDTRDLIRKIDAGLIAAKKDPHRLEPLDMAGVDQLHTGGTRATLSLAKKIAITPETHVLDAGCGLGGSSRLLAATSGCRVTGIDLCSAYIDAATELTRRTGLSDRVDFTAGSVLGLPWDDHTFDVVLCQHILMNIQDKLGAVQQFFRVLKPGGVLLLHEIVKGAHPDLALPVPWAASGDISFLEPWKFLETRLSESRFLFNAVVDVTDAGTRYWQKAREFSRKNAGTLRPLGPHLVFGETAGRFPFTMSQNFETGAIRLVEAVTVRSKSG